jgi:uncharacterized protein YbjT (DUF2867 family)
MDRNVFVSGGTGYIGRALVDRLLERGHTVKALARRGSERKLPSGCVVVPGNALDASSFANAVSADDTFVHLVGVPHPAPWKGTQFRAVDLVALKASVEAATRAGVRHFVFMSVARPAPVMKSYIQVRTECEEIIAAARLTSTVLRPWYVIGPGHWWPLMLQPFYSVAEMIPATRESAQRLGLVTLKQMAEAITWAVENPEEWPRVLGVDSIRMLSSMRSAASQSRSNAV